MLDQVGDAVGDDAGLTAARPSQNKHRSLCRRYSLALWLIEASQ